MEVFKGDYGTFRNLGYLILGVLIILLFRVLYSGPLFFETLPYRSPNNLQPYIAEPTQLSADPSAQARGLLLAARSSLC